MEVLGLALQQDTNLCGLQPPGQFGQTHIHSTFIDDTDSGANYPSCGTCFGLHVQPAKNQLIFLNQSVKLERYAGITVVSTGDTTRYL